MTHPSSVTCAHGQSGGSRDTSATIHFPYTVVGNIRVTKIEKTVPQNKINATSTCTVHDTVRAEQAFEVSGKSILVFMRSQR